MRHAGHALTALASAALAASASAQYTPDSTVSYSLAWSEVDADYLPVPSPNGLLEPGERVLLKLFASFTNPNTIAHFSPPIGTITTGTIRGYGGGFLDLIGSASVGTAAGTWNLDINQGYGLQSPFDAAGEPGFGTPTEGGARVINIEPGQFGGSIYTANPALIWLGVWSPESYQLRQVRFRLGRGTIIASGPFSAVMVRFNASLFGPVTCDSNLGSVTIPVIPAPASLAILVAALPLGARRIQRKERP
jgi:hypothetical protein